MKRGPGKKGRRTNVPALKALKELPITNEPNIARCVFPSGTVSNVYGVKLLPNELELAAFTAAPCASRRSRRRPTSGSPASLEEVHR